ncbi:heterocyst development glycosyltransferase HepC [Coleofasciculus sp. F4-SAH-05]|uniref:heterocyst development glycosyltransferase HepC n=1 Tax=Coleofasciculus sp. F4-SAH-05 TaxID=3069525 RepID=UPI0033003BFC
MTSTTAKSPNSLSSSLVLQWHEDQLFVKRSTVANPIRLSALENDQRLTECLKQSPVKLVSLDKELGETELKRWLDACERAGKPVVINVPSLAGLPKQRRPLMEIFQDVMNSSTAGFLLLSFSPMMLVLAMLMRKSSPEPIFVKQWQVGKNGKLFPMFKFNTTVADHPIIKPVGRWLRKFKLNKLPQLINVIRGEMSLVSPCHLALDEVLFWRTYARELVSQ